METHIEFEYARSLIDKGLEIAQMLFQKVYAADFPLKINGCVMLND